ncbi:MAG: ATP-binding protein [Planctomycetota bacterium]|jgi:anti-sigma regulatory factor (Ser/Thr protein kinase)|nr:ATP-binding protein [Planctomycetota bacterium]
MRRNALNVLIVESEPAIAEALSAALGRRGHQAQVVSHAEVALEQDAPDVLICGATASGDAEYDLLEEFTRRGRQPRSILLLSDPNTLSFRRARELGVEDVLARPFKIAELMNSVERISETNTSSDAPSFSSYSKSYPCDEEAVQRCSKDIAAFALRCGVSPSARARLATAIGELVENAVDHAYPTGGGMLEIDARLEERDVWVCVRDSGVGFDTGVEREEGSGLDRASSLSEGLDVVSSVGSGTEATLRVTIFRSDFDNGNQVDLTELDFFTPKTSRQVLGLVREQDASSYLELSPSLAVVIGRLLSGPSHRATLKASLWN